MAKKMKSFRVSDATQKMLDKLLEEYTFENETDVIEHAISELAAAKLTPEQYEDCYKINKR